MHYYVNSNGWVGWQMTSIFDIDIIESAEELKELLSSQTNARLRSAG